MGTTPNALAMAEEFKLDRASVEEFCKAEGIPYAMVNATWRRIAQAEPQILLSDVLYCMALAKQNGLPLIGEWYTPIARKGDHGEPKGFSLCFRVDAAFYILTHHPGIEDGIHTCEWTTSDGKKHDMDNPPVFKNADSVDMGLKCTVTATLKGKPRSCTLVYSEWVPRKWDAQLNKFLPAQRWVTSGAYMLYKQTAKEFTRRYVGAGLPFEDEAPWQEPEASDGLENQKCPVCGMVGTVVKSSKEGAAYECSKRRKGCGTRFSPDSIIGPAEKPALPAPTIEVKAEPPSQEPPKAEGAKKAPEPTPEAAKTVTLEPPKEVKTNKCVTIINEIKNEETRSTEGKSGERVPGKPYLRIITDAGTFFCFDTKLFARITASSKLGDNVEFIYTVKERNGKTLWTVTEFSIQSKPGPDLSKEYAELEKLVGKEVAPSIQNSLLQWVSKGESAEEFMAEIRASYGKKPEPQEEELPFDDDSGPEQSNVDGLL